MPTTEIDSKYDVQSVNEDRPRRYRMERDQAHRLAAALSIGEGCTFFARNNDQGVYAYYRDGAPIPGQANDGAAIRLVALTEEDCTAIIYVTEGEAAGFFASLSESPSTYGGPEGIAHRVEMLEFFAGLSSRIGRDGEYFRDLAAQYRRKAVQTSHEDQS